MQKLSENQKKRQNLYIKKTKTIHKSRAKQNSKRFEKEQQDFVKELINKKVESFRKRSIGWNCKLIISKKINKELNYAINQ